MKSLFKLFHEWSFENVKLKYNVDCSSYPMICIRTTGAYLYLQIINHYSAKACVILPNS